MVPCCWAPPASVAGTGRDLYGSTVTLNRPPMRGSAKLVCRLRLVSQMSNGCLIKELLLHQIRVKHRSLEAAWNSKLEAWIKLCLFGCSGALELWELAEDEHLLVNRFTKYDHDHIVTTVSPVTGANSAVTGSMDCRSDSFTRAKWGKNFTGRKI